MATFGEVFQENMNAVGAPASPNMFTNVGAAVNLLTGITGFLERYGTRALVSEMLTAGVLGKMAPTVGAMYGAYYLGAGIGSLAVATCATFPEGLSVAKGFGLFRDWLLPTLLGPCFPPDVGKAPILPVTRQMDWNLTEAARVRAYGARCRQNAAMAATFAGCGSMALLIQATAEANAADGAFAAEKADYEAEWGAWP